MVENDAQLIQRTLAGDEAAFTALVRKYQKGVHALAWRKVGDFHIAEEITQDTFLQAHKKLTTLQNPNQFAGWLYVITNRMCIRWFKNKKPAMLSLEKISRTEVDKSSYKHYISEQRETEAAEHRYEMVKELLKKLPESERTVVTLHYLGEMTAKEIGNFLGVSVNTIKSRLQRARKRLRSQNEESLIREVLRSFQLSVGLTENIIRQVADLKLTPPQVGKPLLPWAAFGTAVLLIVLMLGTHNQYLARFQQPYSFEAESEPTVEIVDAPITLHLLSKPAVRNRIGRAATPTKNIGTNLRTSETAVASPTTAELPTTFSTAPWTQMSGPAGGFVFDIFETSKRTLYVNSSIGVYRLTADATVWTPVSVVNTSIDRLRMPVAEHAGILYIVAANELLASTDDGETWNALGPRPEGHPAELIVIDAVDGHSANERVTMYLAFWDKGIFRSTDAGKHWTPVNNGLTGRKIYELVAIEGTVFTGTDRGLYRLNADVWEQLPVDTTKAVHGLAVFEDTLYVGTGPKLNNERMPAASRRGRIFKSSDLGTSWTEITPKDEDYPLTAVGTPMAVRHETILVRGVWLFRSKDNGMTWTNLGFDQDFFTYLVFDENTFYKTGNYGVYRTTDAGESWHHFMDGMVGTGARDLVVFNNSLYVHADGNMVQSAADGEPWMPVPVDYAERASEPSKREPPNRDFEPDSKFVSVDNVLYGIGSGRDNLRIFHSSGDNTFIPVQGVPDFGAGNLSPVVLKEIAVAEGMSFSGDPEKDRKVMMDVSVRENYGKAGAFAVSGDTFYVEYKRKLFKWKPGDSEWKNTGLIDTGKRPNDGSKNGFKLAALAETVYVGKRDGRLFQSLDGGSSWRDITPSLPLRFTQFKEIVFVDSTAYVATDRGILTSQTGTYWRVLTDTAGERIVIDRFAVGRTSVYGAGDAGVYRLDDRRRSKQIYPSVPDRILSLAVKNDKLYIVTRHHGMFQIPLTEAGDNLSRK